jgi:hypothetical protein
MEPVVSTIAALFRAVHGNLRDEIRDLDAEALNWSPAPETNSVAALVVHTVGSEAEVLRTVRAVPGDRDRDAEFRVQADTAADLIAQLDSADALLDEMTAGITSSDLTAMRPRGDRPPAQGLYWLVSNYGHAREHLAHVQLTLQLYRARQAR